MTAGHESPQVSTDEPEEETDDADGRGDHVVVVVTSHMCCTRKMGFKDILGKKTLCGYILVYTNVAIL